MPNPPVFSLEYLATLLKGKIGRYRVVVFVVTNDFFSQASGKRVEVEQAATLAIEGANHLPKSVSDQAFTDEYSCTALVYEFQRLAVDEPTVFKENCTVTAETHLQKIIPHLERSK